MRRKGWLWIVFLMLISMNGYSVIDQSTAKVPETLKLGGGLQQMREKFYKTSDFVQQLILVKMITKNQQEDRYLLLEEIALWPIRLADKYGEAKNLDPEAWQIAINALANSGKPQFSDTLSSIVKNAGNTDIRITAAKGLGKLKNPSSLDLLISLVRSQYNYDNFRENDEQMFQDDRVVQAIVETMGEIGDPKVFTVLLGIVTKRNHRAATIQAAWDAMEKLKW